MGVAWTLLAFLFTMSTMNFNRSLSDLYRSFKDRRLAIKFNGKPEGYFLYLPRHTKKMFVDIYIKAGALSEKEEQAGIGHLLEHYLATLTNKELPSGVKFDAKINDQYIVFYLESDNEKTLEDSVETLLETLAHPDFSHQEIFDYEKRSILNELEREKNEVELKLERLVERVRYTDEPNGRSFVDHLQRLAGLKIEHIAAYHKGIFTEGNIEIFVSATKPNSKILNTITSALSKLDLPEEGSVEFPKPAYSDFQIHISEELGASGNDMIMTFPSINQMASLRDRIVFALLVEIMRDKERKSFWQKTREAGIYDLRVTYSQGISNGYLAIQTHLSKEQIEPCVEIICDMIRELRNATLDPILLEKTKEKWAEEMLASWRSNEGRFNFLSDCILNHEEIPSSTAVEKMIGSVSGDDISAMAQRIFERDRMNLVLFGEDIGFDQEKLKQTLIF